MNLSKTLSSFRKLLFFPLMVVAMLAVVECAKATTAYEVSSPNGKIRVSIRVGERIEYDVLFNQKPLVQNATLSLDIDGHRLGLNARVSTATPATVDRQIKPAVPQKFASVREHFNELYLRMQEDYGVRFRAYDDGVAYRFETSLPRNQVKVDGEEVTLKFAGVPHVYYPKEDSFFSHNEREFLYLAITDIGEKTIASIPAVVAAEDGVKVIIAESDVDDYPGLWLRGNSNNTLSATFPHFPAKEQLKGDRDLRVTKTEDYIASTNGRRTFPWRILGIAAMDADIMTNQLVYLLAKPSQVADTSWIKPGKVAWDWYNANNIYGVDFKSGINTATYKYYIDFASKHGIEYIILDEGWYKLGNLLDVVPEMSIETLIAYGKQRNVGIILWVVWKTLDDQFEAAFDQFEKWGVKGLKVDFMQRDDQRVMNFYERVCREAAKRKMLVDFHGAIRPALLTRTWPNLLTTEGVRGLEQSKWSKLANPEHNTVLPFTRMFVGPVDYTPGAMVNSGSEKYFAPVFERPMSLGTRCQQLAMYVIYESPLQMLADSPSHYLREPEVMRFLGPIPTVWDDTRVLQARIGDYVAIARRRNSDWYVGAITDWTPRELQIDFSFLPRGRYQLEAFQDGANADRFGSDYKRVIRTVINTDKLNIKLASGGGWAARLTPQRAKS